MNGRVDLSGHLAGRAFDPVELMQRVTDEMLILLAGADGVLLALALDEGSLRFVCGSGRLAAFVGETLPADGTLAGQALASARILISADTERDPRVSRDHARAYHVRSSVCVPLLRDEERIGVLAVSSSAPAAFDRLDVELLGELAGFVAAVVGSARDLAAASSRRTAGCEDAEARAHKLERARRAETFLRGVLDPVACERSSRRVQIERVLAGRQFALVVQPIFELDTGRLFAAEALVRFPHAPDAPPNVVLAQAHAVGLGTDLEAAIVERAVELLPRLPDGVALTVNASPETLARGPVPALLAAAAQPERIVVELTEHVAVSDYPRLARSLASMRAAGVRLAVDDAGAGFASLMHILKLAPNFIKLDRELTAGIDGDPMRRSLVCSLLRFSGETHTPIIAEGIETAAELGIMQELGIGYGQGYHLARPERVGVLARSARGGANRIVCRAGADPIDARRLSATTG
jgi:EAL domain-containing protein (putative c-di-GMP-specific phosphodiesterase class I)